MFIIAAATFFLLIIAYLLLLRRRRTSLDKMHCMITGGSSGIGLALAVEVARKGGNVTIIARSKERLSSAKDLILAEIKSPEQKVLTFSADVSKHDSVLENIVNEAQKESGSINLLFNCAGTSVCYPFVDTPIEDFSRMININYLGSIYMTRAVLPSMMERKSGSVVFVSSIAGLMGVYGFTAYSASKFALLGLAESLQMEVKPHNVNITVAFPPDTDTPGFAEEIKNKPIETMRISESAGLFSAEKVAIAILRDSLDKKFLSTVGMDGKIVSILCCGMTPINSFMDLVLQVITMGIIRLASVLILFQFDRIIRKCAIEKQNLKEEKES